MSFSQAVADEICARMREGESLRTICRSPGMPAASTVCLWVEQWPDFAEQYARAREALIDVYAQEVIEIADESPAMIFKDVQGAEVISIDSAAVNHQRLRVDARKWYAGKVAPKKYGDRVEHELGSNPDKPLVHKVITWEIIDAAAPKAV